MSLGVIRREGVAATSWVLPFAIPLLFFPSVAFDSYSVLTSIYHTCINPCGQYRWGVVHRHRPLVHCLWDQWPLKSFVAFLMLVDTVNLVFCIYTSYQFGVTNFGDYQSNQFDPWSQAAITLSAIVLAISVEHFYAYRVYHLGGGSPYLPAAISVTSLTEFGLGILFSAKVLKHTHDLDPPNFKGFFIATLIPKVPCDALITVGMVYHLLSSRTQIRRTNNVLNSLTIYFINCGTLHL
ncbi:hypothetical protein EDB84DRAFT_551512 [Lactarius hengduanensis]|nr:hypothetical protein EDB84DRAFT_551512 [Lactarius hengduanensis]